MDLKELSEFYDESTMDFDEFINMHAPKHTRDIKQEQDLEYLKSEQLDREKKSKQEPNPKKEPNPKVENQEPTEDPKPTLKELRALRLKHLEK
jgi:hypothetical protein